MLFGQVGRREGRTTTFRLNVVIYGPSLWAASAVQVKGGYQAGPASPIILRDRAWTPKTRPSPPASEEQAEGGLRNENFFSSVMDPGRVNMTRPGSDCLSLDRAGGFRQRETAAPLQNAEHRETADLEIILPAGTGSSSSSSTSLDCRGSLKCPILRLAPPPSSCSSSSLSLSSSLGTNLKGSQSALRRRAGNSCPNTDDDESEGDDTDDDCASLNSTPIKPDGERREGEGETGRGTLDRGQERRRGSPSGRPGRPGHVAGPACRARPGPEKNPAHTGPGRPHAQT
ncbi:hypothetical protein EJ110_NYTH07914 [Nymphaea thermarum]|nr:hypothetical protein EJ110_NYTH07914 [Nymphaea thermarum]